MNKNSIKHSFLGTWNIIKKFPITCYGIFSLISYSIFSYDFFIIGLIPGYPFIWFIGKIINFVFTENFLIVLISGHNSIHLVIVYVMAITVSILLDLLISYIWIRIRKKGVRPALLHGSEFR